MLLGDVHVGSHELNRIPRSVVDRVAHYVNVPNRPIVQNDPIVGLKMACLADRLANWLLKRWLMGRVHPAEYHFESQFRFRWVEAEDAKALLAEENFSCRNVAGPTPGMAEPLALRQIGFAPPHRFFRFFSLRNIAIDPVNFRRASVDRHRGCYK